MSEDSKLQIHESLSGESAQSRWRKAINSAEKCFQEVKFLAAGMAVHHHYNPETAMIAARYNFGRARNISGKICLQKVFDNQAVLLEIEFETEEDNKERLEMFFDESGLVLHAAIGTA